MKALAQHIEQLLFENDCVIVPHFGGFVAQYVPARYEAAENRWYAPYRTVGFNERLTLNDGLLVQAYMESHQVNFPQAQNAIDRAVEELLAQLATQPEVMLPGIGSLARNANGTLCFTPLGEGIDSPQLYALSSFEMYQLAATTEPAPAADGTSTTPAPETQTAHVVLHLPRTLLRHAVATAAAIALLFIFALPTHNTSLPVSQHVAAISPLQFLQNIHTPTLTYQPIQTAGVAQPDTLSEPLVALPQPNPRLMPNKLYYIIVASVASSAEAEHMVAVLAEKGYTEASVVEGDGRIRIALWHYQEREEAEAQLANLRTNPQFADAWLLPKRLNTTTHEESSLPQM